MRRWNILKLLVIFHLLFVFLAIRPPLIHATEDLVALSTSEPNLLVLGVRLDEYTFPQQITAYQIGPNIFLPLGELSQLLTIAVKTKPQQSTASGYIISEKKTFSLNAIKSEISIGGEARSFDPSLVYVETDDIFIESRLLSTWLPIDINIRLSELLLSIKPREQLPVQLRLIRERLVAGIPNIDTREYKNPGYPRQEIPYKLWDWPFLDQTISLDYKSKSQLEGDYTAYLTGDLLKMESTFYLDTSIGKDQDTNFRGILARNDPNAGLLGFMKARSLSLGSVVFDGTENISSSVSTDGYGINLSNKPLTNPTSFGRQTLEGDLLSGWDVMLYQNDVLIGYQQSSSTGKYSFEDIVLVYGKNEFRLVFTGPFGETIVKTENFLLEQAIARPGDFFYNLNSYMDKDNKLHFTSQFDYGIAKHFSVNLGYTHVPVDEKGENYGFLNMYAYWKSFILSGQLIQASNRGNFAELGLKTKILGLSVETSYARLSKFSSEVFLPTNDFTKTKEKFRIDGSIPLLFYRIPFTAWYNRKTFESSSEEIDSGFKLSAYLMRTAMTNSLQYQRINNAETIDGTFFLNRVFGGSRGVHLRGQVDYTINPGDLTGISISANKNLGEYYKLNGDLNYSIETGDTRFSLGFTKDIGPYGLSVSLGNSTTDGFMANLRFLFSMSRNPRSKKWTFDSRPAGDTGALSARVFLDRNLNGIFDENDEPLNGVRFILNNGSVHPVSTDSKGLAYLTHLSIKQDLDISLYVPSLKDPLLRSQKKGIRVTPRAGKSVEIEFPVIMTSEIDGTVSLVKKDSGEKGLGGIRLELLNLNGEIISSTITAWDGFYILSEIPAGKYLLRISPTQLEEFNLFDPGLKQITISGKGDFINGIDFSLSEKNSDPI